MDSEFRRNDRVGKSLGDRPLWSAAACCRFSGGERGACCTRPSKSKPIILRQLRHPLEAEAEGRFLRLHTVIEIETCYVAVFGGLLYAKGA